jgi:hypothetical protein
MSDPVAVLEATAIVAPPPRWVSPLFLILGIGLVPWTFLLAFTLPDHHGTNHYNLAWTGFDVVLAASLIATAVGTARRANWLQSIAAIAAALLVCDAWFDVLSSTTRSELVISLTLAAFVELPVAAACIFVSRHAEETADRARRYAAYVRRRGGGDRRLHHPVRR